jgi:hypothetical protein
MTHRYCHRHLAAAALALAALSPIAPARGQIAVLSDAVAQRTAAPGESYQANLLVRNMTDVPQEARVYQTDYSFTADGRSNFATPGSLPRSNAKWLSVAPSRLVIPPQTTVPVVYTVKVPADTSLRGSYWSIIMIEAVTPPADPRAPSAKPTVGLSVTTRYGTQIATDIGRSGVAKLAFDSLTATSTPDGNHGLRFDFINTGERAQRLTMSLELYNEAGDLVKKASQVRGLLYPGTAARQTFDVGAVPAGAYTAVLVADGGGDQVFGGQFKIAY